MDTKPAIRARKGTAALPPLPGKYGNGRVYQFTDARLVSDYTHLPWRGRIRLALAVLRGSTGVFSLRGRLNVIANGDPISKPVRSMEHTDFLREAVR